MAAGGARRGQDHVGDGGLAAAGFADDGKNFRLVRRERKADVVDRHELAARQQPADRKNLADMVEFEHGRVHAPSASPARWQATRPRVWLASMGGTSVLHRS